MRGFLFLPALAAAALAGCGERQDSGQASSNQVAPAAVAESAAPASEPDAPVNSAGSPLAPAPTTAAAATVPVAMLGVYDATLEACGRPSDARLTVAPTELRFHESIGTVRKVSSIGTHAVRVEADYQGEGERWRSVRELRLGDGGNQLTISGDGTRLARVRCPAEAR